MDRMFSISQVAQMLGLGIDAVRFYEKKGLVHPQVNPKNRYRMYSVYQIMELLDVGYYRGLGMSIEQIRSIYDQCDEEQLMHLLHQKRLETEKRSATSSSCSSGSNMWNRLRQRFRRWGRVSIFRSFPRAIFCLNSGKTA